MKRILLTIVLLFATTLTLSAQPDPLEEELEIIPLAPFNARLEFEEELVTISLESTAQKARVAVYMTGNDPINEIVSNRLMSDLIKSGQYSPIERSADFLAAVAKEHSYERSGEVDDEQIAALGKQFGLQYVCVISIYDVWQDVKYFTIRIIDVNSARIIRTCYSVGTFNSEKNELMKVLDDLPVSLRNIWGNAQYDDIQSFLPKIAVYAVKTGNKDIDVVLGDQLVRGFVNDEHFVAVERSNAFLKQLQKEKGYQYSGAVDDNERIAELGKNSGVQYVCVAKTIPYGDAYYISTRIINVESGEIEAMCNLENVSMDTIWSVVDNAYDLVDELDAACSRISDNFLSDMGFDKEDGRGEIFTIVENDPEFPGGMEALCQYFSKNLRYPALAKECNITGKVYVSFVVEKDGSIARPRIIRDIGGGCGAESVRVVRAMPRWKLGRQYGKRVRVKFNLPSHLTYNNLWIDCSRGVNHQ